MNTLLIENSTFKRATSDYYYLLSRDYRDNGILKMIGDRYRLSTLERTILYRGIIHPEQTICVSPRIVKSPGKELIIDGYNVLITLLNYRLGHLVFISTDKLCRDAGSLFGKIKDENLFRECMQIFAEYLTHIASCEIVIYLDSPVSHSAEHRKILQQITAENPVNPVISVVHSADEAMLLHSSGTYATSDSAVLKKTVNPVIDIPRAVIESKYRAELPDLSIFL
jgi:hypothetical protein